MIPQNILENIWSYLATDPKAGGEAQVTSDNRFWAIRKGKFRWNFSFQNYAKFTSPPWRPSASALRPSSPPRPSGRRCRAGAVGTTTSPGRISKKYKFNDRNLNKIFILSTFDITLMRVYKQILTWVKNITGSLALWDTKSRSMHS